MYSAVFMYVLYVLALSSTNRMIITSDDNVVSNNHAIVPIQQLPQIGEEKIDICKYLLCTCQTYQDTRYISNN